MKDRLEAIKAAALAKINEADVLTSLNDVKVSVLGKKGELTQVLKGMKDVAPEDRPKVGQMVNEARQAIETALEEKSKNINRGQTFRQLYEERVKFFEKYADITICEDGCEIEDTIENVLEEVKKLDNVQ